MKWSTLGAWAGFICVFIGLAYPAFLVIGFGLFLVSAIIRSVQIDQTWKNLDKKLKDLEK